MLVSINRHFMSELTIFNTGIDCRVAQVGAVCISSGGNKAGEKYRDSYPAQTCRIWNKFFVPWRVELESKITSSSTVSYENYRITSSKKGTHSWSAP